MSLPLAETAKVVTIGVHAVLLLDQAAWHTTQKLVRSANITLLTLLARSLELNPVEISRQDLTRELDRQPDLCLQRGHPRSLLRRLEQDHQPAWLIASIELRARTHEL